MEIRSSDVDIRNSEGEEVLCRCGRQHAES
jgi:hypothetical protein